VAEKTEEPTPKRLRDARRKGQIAFSQDVPGAAAFLAGMALVVFWAPRIADHFREQFVTVTKAVGRVDASTLAGVWSGPFREAGFAWMWGAGTVVAGVALAGVGLAVAQAGFNLTFERLRPQLAKLNPVQGLKRWFSIAGLVELLKTAAKVAIVFAVGYYAVSGRFEGILSLHRVDLVRFYELLAQVLWSFVLPAGFAFALISGFDYYFQWRRWKKGLMMSKDEVKQEYKEQEGDPIIKSQRKALHQELAMQQIAHEVPLADAVVVNPTHLAVAVKYDRDKMAAPRVTAKGGGAIARRMRELARKHEVPLVRDVSLARALFAVEMGRYIPRDLYEAVAEVLLFASRLREEGERARDARW
jgi:flagellar biosynthesis protein FlhB